MGDFDTAGLPDLSSDGDLSAPTGSGLAAIRGRRAKAVADLTIDLPVPRSEDIFGQRVIVRFRPITDAERRRAEKASAKKKGDDVDVLVNAQVLAVAALGIFTPVERDDPESWMRFDRDLAGLILDEDPAEVGVANSAEVVRLLYATEGDILATGAKLAEFSGYSLAEIEEDDAGN